MSTMENYYLQHKRGSHMFLKLISMNIYDHRKQMHSRIMFGNDKYWAAPESQLHV